MPIEIRKADRSDLLKQDIESFQRILDKEPDNELAARMLAKREEQLKALGES